MRRQHIEIYADSTVDIGTLHSVNDTFDKQQCQIDFMRIEMDQLRVENSILAQQIGEIKTILTHHTGEIQSISRQS